MKHFAWSFIIISFLACKNNVTNPPKPPTQDSSKATNVIKKQVKVENGEYIERYDNGMIRIKGMMKNGKRDGLWRSWYVNGVPWSETTFKDGVKTGPTSTWYPNNRKRYDGFYVDDKEAGKWTYWDEKGKELSSKIYEN
ncbi:MAG: hypothetical protein WCP52_08795 [Bacteroidota bacterium]